MRLSQEAGAPASFARAEDVLWPALLAGLSLLEDLYGLQSEWEESSASV
jgi:hypothetical protein